MAGMRQLLLVGIGGAIGAVARWGLGGFILHQTPTWQFPLGTFIVNVLGCVVAGALAGLVVKWNLFSADMRVFLFTGLVGGFTTFSAFGIDTIYLIRRSEYAVALAYVVLSVTAGLVALWLAMLVTPEGPDS